MLNNRITHSFQRLIVSLHARQGKAYDQYDPVILSEIPLSIGKKQNVDARFLPPAAS
jgi:hypothetical protein